MCRGGEGGEGRGGEGRGGEGRGGEGRGGEGREWEKGRGEVENVSNGQGRIDGNIHVSNDLCTALMTSSNDIDQRWFHCSNWYIKPVKPVKPVEPLKLSDPQKKSYE